MKSASTFAPSSTRAALAPTIKGIFVKSHVQAVDRALGAGGVASLERLYGAPVRFRDLQDVPVRDEVRLIECALRLLHPAIPEADVPYEAGRLHFTNFSTTPWAKIIFSIFPRNFRYQMLHAPTIAQRVFKGVRFTATDGGGQRVVIRMENADYAMDHFRGLFQAWLEYSGLAGGVEAAQLGPRHYQYTVDWRTADA